MPRRTRWSVGFGLAVALGLLLGSAVSESASVPEAGRLPLTANSSTAATTPFLPTALAGARGTGCDAPNPELGLCPEGVALNASWSEVPGAGPPARYRAAIAYDPVDASVILFGGCGRVCALADTWSYAAGVWRNLTGTTSATPPGGAGASMAYYPGVGAGGYLVMFGGFGPNGYLNDTWGFVDGMWLSIDGSGVAPPARAGASLTYDPATQSLILFGGSSNVAGRSLLNDTWSFADNAWTELSASSGPPSRAEAAMAYDPSLGSVVLFGGAISSGIAKDTWQFADGNWTRTSVPTAPSSRSGATLVYDTALDALVLWGGLGRVGYEADTWVFTGATWVEQLPAQSPSALTGAAATYDAADGYLLTYGGWNLSSFSGSTWAYGSNLSFGVLVPAPGPATTGARGVDVGISAAPILVGAFVPLPRLRQLLLARRRE